jgi:hypothetical protein
MSKATKAAKRSSGNRMVFFRGDGIFLTTKDVFIIFAEEFRVRGGAEAQAFLRMHKVDSKHVLMIEPVSDGLCAVHTQQPLQA